MTKAERDYATALISAYSSATQKILNTRGAHTKERLTKILSEIRQELIKLNSDFAKALQPNLFQITQVDALATQAEMAATLKYVGINDKLYRLPVSTIKEIANLGSMSFFRLDSKDVLHEATYTAKRMIESVYKSQYKRVKAVMLGEYAAGATPEEIVRKLKPYMVDSTVKDARTVVRTLIAEASQESKNKFYRENMDVTDEYLFVAVLDNRTSSICRSLDGRRFETIKPAYSAPLHPNCRSVLLAVPIGYQPGQRPIVKPDGTVTIVKDKGFTYKDAIKMFPELNNKKLIDVDEYIKKVDYYKV